MILYNSHTSNAFMFLMSGKDMRFQVPPKNVQTRQPDHAMNQAQVPDRSTDRGRKFHDFSGPMRLID